MATHDPGDLDGVACPHLGIDRDPRTRYLYSHPDHRCFAGEAPVAVEPPRQSVTCLHLSFAMCRSYVERDGRLGNRPDPGVSG